MNLPTSISRGAGRLTMDTTFVAPTRILLKSSSSPIAPTMSRFRAVNDPDGDTIPASPSQSQSSEIGVPANHPQSFWLRHIDTHVRMHCGENGLASHIDAEQIYGLLCRSKDFQTIDRSGPKPKKVKKSCCVHSLWKDYRISQTELIAWMNGKSHWEENFTLIPAFGGPETLVAIIIIADQQGHFPKAWESQWKQMQLGHIIREVGSVTVHPFWKGARFESASWRSKYMAKWTPKFASGTILGIHNWVRKGPFVPEPPDSAWESVTYLEASYLNATAQSIPVGPETQAKGKGRWSDTDSDSGDSQDEQAMHEHKQELDGASEGRDDRDEIPMNTTTLRFAKPLDSQTITISRRTPWDTPASQDRTHISRGDTPKSASPLPSIESDELVNMADTSHGYLRYPSAGVVDSEPERYMVTLSFNKAPKRERSGSPESLQPAMKKLKIGSSSLDKAGVAMLFDESEGKMEIMASHLKYLQRYEVLDIIELFDYFNSLPAAFWEVKVDSTLIHRCEQDGPEDENGTPRRYQWNLILNLVRGMFKKTGHFGADGKLVDGHVPELKAEYVWPS